VWFSREAAHSRNGSNWVPECTNIKSIKFESLLDLTINFPVSFKPDPRINDHSIHHHYNHQYQYPKSNEDKDTKYPK
jgi:hypothetical protein